MSQVRQQGPAGPPPSERQGSWWPPPATTSRRSEDDRGLAPRAPRPSARPGATEEPVRAKLELLLQHVLALDEAIKRKVAASEARTSEMILALRAEFEAARDDLQARTERTEAAVDQLSALVGRMLGDISERIETADDRFRQQFDRLTAKLTELEARASRREIELEQSVVAALEASERHVRARVQEALGEFERQIGAQGRGEAHRPGRRLDQSRHHDVAPRWTAAVDPPAAPLAQTSVTAHAAEPEPGFWSSAPPPSGRPADQWTRAPAADDAPELEGLKRALDSLHAPAPQAGPAAPDYAAPAASGPRSGPPPEAWRERPLTGEAGEANPAGEEPPLRFSAGAAWMIAGAAAALSLGVVGVAAWNNSSQAHSKPISKEGLAPLQQGELSPPGALPSQAWPQGATQVLPELRGDAAFAPAGPAALNEVATAPAPGPAVRGAPSSPAARAVSDFERLSARAGAGEARAQLQLAGLYAKGAGGAPRDLAQARRWTLAAAQGGEPVAMHNLALDYLRGDRGPADAAAAVSWFRKAAERGVTDSQFNLGALYEEGVGVKADADEALRWFKLAAANGDEEARQRAARLEGRTASAASSAPQSQAASADGAILDTQRRLARAGYYVGPLDGRDSPSYRSALATFQRDMDLTGGRSVDLPIATARR